MRQYHLERQYSNDPRIKACVDIVATQIPDCPEANVLLGIYMMALKDAFERKPFNTSTPGAMADLRGSAYRYLRGPMPNMAAMGIEPAWIRKTMRVAGLNLEEVKR